MKMIYSDIKKIYIKSKGTFLGTLFDKGKNLFNSWYWSERTVHNHIGNYRNDSNDYYIIRRYASGMGIGSYIISNISQIKYALDMGYIPVIDMLNYNSTIIDKTKIVNSWELYFQQPLSTKLEIAYKSKKYILSDGSLKNDAPNDSLNFLSGDNIKNWQNIFAEYIKPNDILKKYQKDEYNNLIYGKGKILGVLCRGTDYLKLQPTGHPIQPTVEEIISKIDEVIADYDYIYLATEDEMFDNKLRKYYKNKIIINKRVYKSYTNGYLSETENNRVNDNYLSNMEYLSSLYLLSKCDALISGRTSGAVIVMLMNPKYKYSFFWDLGLYK